MTVLLQAYGRRSRDRRSEVLSIRKIANFAEHSLRQTGFWNGAGGNRKRIPMEDGPSTKLPKQALVYDERQRLFYQKENSWLLIRCRYSHQGLLMKSKVGRDRSLRPSGIVARRHPSEIHAAVTQFSWRIGQI